MESSSQLYSISEEKKAAKALEMIDYLRMIEGRTTFQSSTHDTVAAAMATRVIFLQNIDSTISLTCEDRRLMNFHAKMDKNFSAITESQDSIGTPL